MQRTLSSTRRAVLAVLTAAVVVGGTLHADAAVKVKFKAEDWIVLFDNDVTDVRALAEEQAKAQGATVTNVLDGAIKGFSATFTSKVPGRTAMKWDRRVSWLERDQVVKLSPVKVKAASPSLKQAQTPIPNPYGSGTLHVPDGIDRIDQRHKLASKLPNGLPDPDFDKYIYTATGGGVTAYVVDTGVMGTHPDFSGRVTQGYDATSSSGFLGLFGPTTPKRADVDCNGHGTHVAGTIGGEWSGAAKDVRIVPVKVLGCNGSGSVSQIVKGINWVIGDHAAGTPAVANLSIGGAKSSTWDRAVQALVADGVTVAVAAGNSNADACKSSPGGSGAPDVLTVGATDPYKDTRTSWSEWGTCLDLYAPGNSILSAGTGSEKFVYMSGTSMAAPHIAGAAALFLGLNPGLVSANVGTPKNVPIEVGKALLATATANVPVYKNSTNRQLYVGSPTTP